MIKYVALLMSSPPGRQGGREGAAPGVGQAGVGLGTPAVALGMRCPLEVVVAEGGMVQWGAER